MPSSNLKSQKDFISQQGAKKIQKELDTLWTVERRKVVKEVSDAAAQGDRSENAEYIYGKKRLREIDRRLQFLNQRLKQCEIVDVTRIKNDQIYFGSIVTLENNEGDEIIYQLLGPDESDAEKRIISINSPVGKALLGRKVNEEVTIKIPKGIIEYIIIKIEVPIE